MTTNHLQEINQCDQSIWMDNLSRGIMKSGELKDLVENKGISGITSNPAIFEKAIAGDKTQGINTGNIIYNANIEAGVSAGLPTSKIYESLVFADIRNACDILRPRPHPQRRDVCRWVDWQAIAKPTLRLCSVTTAGDRLKTGVQKAYTLIENLKDPDINIDLDTVMDELLVEGIDQFIQPFQSLMNSLEEKIKVLSPV